MVKITDLSGMDVKFSSLVTADTILVVSGREVSERWGGFVRDQLWVRDWYTLQTMLLGRPPLWSHWTVGERELRRERALLQRHS